MGLFNWLKKSKTISTESDSLVINSKDKAEALLHKYIAIIDQNNFDQIENFTLGLNNEVIIPKSTIDEWEYKKAERERQSVILNKTVSLNNEGVEFEKNGNVEAAIKCYEENILLGYPATHSYNRLVILFRKQKLYAEELRVIDKAIVNKAGDAEKWKSRKEKVMVLIEKQ